MRGEFSLEESQEIIRKTCQAMKQLSTTCPTAKFLDDYAFHIVLNANDTFGYACADAVDVSVEDLPKLLEVEKLFGADGVTAFMALVREEEPLTELQVDKYWEAVEYLKDYKPASWVL